MFLGRQIQIIWDTVNNVFYDVNTGELTSAVPYLSQGEQVLAQIQYIQGIDSNGNYIPVILSGISAFSGNVNERYNEQSGLAIQEASDVFNVAGDWMGGLTANPYYGQISVRLDGSQSNVVTHLLNKSVINSKLEVLGTIPSGSRGFVQRFPFYIYNNQDTTGTTPTPLPSGLSYITVSQAYATFWPKRQGKEQLGSDGLTTYVWGEPIASGGDELWHARVRIWQDGILSEALDQNGFPYVP